MARDLFIGIDIGTTSIKAGLFDTTDHPLETYGAAYPTRRHPDGRVEQNPDHWRDHIGRALPGFSGARDM